MKIKNNASKNREVFVERIYQIIFKNNVSSNTVEGIVFRIGEYKFETLPELKSALKMKEFM